MGLVVKNDSGTVMCYICLITCLITCLLRALDCGLRPLARRCNVVHTPRYDLQLPVFRSTLAERGQYCMLEPLRQRAATLY